MSTELVPAVLDTASPSIPGTGGIVAAFLAGRNPRTLRGYAADLADFARFINAASPSAAVELLISGQAGHANALALAYKADLIGRELAALRSMVRVARQIDRVSWSLEVEVPRSEPYRDTTGPGRDGWRMMLADATEAARAGPRGRRELAIIRLLHDVGVRRGEAVALDFADVDLDACSVRIVGKGKTEPVRVTLSHPARDALAGWIADRGDVPGPLFVRLDPAASGTKRLTGDAVVRLVKALGRKAGLPREVRPHGLRHQAITRALDLCGGDVRRVRHFSRHAKIDTLLRYDDNRRDEAGTIARLLGGDDLRRLRPD
jgi:integrase/recombinase XerC